MAPAAAAPPSAGPGPGEATPGAPLPRAGQARTWWDCWVTNYSDIKCYGNYYIQPICISISNNSNFSTFYLIFWLNPVLCSAIDYKRHIPISNRCIVAFITWCPHIAGGARKGNLPSGRWHGDAWHQVWQLYNLVFLHCASLSSCRKRDEVDANGLR